MADTGIFPVEVWWHIFEHVDWTDDGGQGLYYGSRDMIVMVREWLRSRHPYRYAHMAIMYGFLEVLDPLELSVCSQHRPTEDLPVMMPRSVKMCPHLLHQELQIDLLLRYGEVFWKWLRNNKARTRVKRNIAALRMTFEPPPRTIDMTHIHSYLSVALTLNKYVIDIAKISRSIGIHCILIERWEPRASEDSWMQVLETFMEVDGLARHIKRFIKRGWMRVIRWIIDNYPRIGFPYTLILRIEDRELLQYMLSRETRTEYDLYNMKCRYSNLDLLPPGIHIVNVKNCPEKIDHEWFANCAGNADEYYFDNTIAMKDYVKLVARHGGKIHMSRKHVTRYSPHDIREYLGVTELEIGTWDYPPWDEERVKVFREFGVSLHGLGKVENWDFKRCNDIARKSLLNVRDIK